VAVTEDPSGVNLWERFDDECANAAAARDRAVEKATKERGHFVSSSSLWRVKPSERVKAAVESRFAGRVKAAEEQYEEACRSAQKELFEALDQLEARA
jgi:hypothetical protein